MPSNNLGIKKAIAPIAIPATTTFKIDFVILSGFNFSIIMFFIVEDGLLCFLL
jgi:hypothetical protein